MNSKIYVKSYDPGPVFNGVCFVAQSPGKTEILKKIPLCGATGHLLEEECVKVGIDFDKSWRGNVVGLKPPNNDFKYFCAKKAEVGGKDYTLKPIRSGQYLKPEYLPELDRLRKELIERKPNLVVALGAEALWALCSLSGITKYRGTVIESTLVPGLKVLPTFHPASVFRQYGNRLYLSLDLFKAKTELEFPEIKIIEREIHLYPDSPKELWNWYSDQSNSVLSFDRLCSVDIEDRTQSGKKIIECIGFAFSPYNALVVPFWSDFRENHNYWRTLEEELDAWKFVEFVLLKHPILGQNFCTYDMWVMYKEMGLRVKHPSEDTMIQHHSFMPEMKKGLGLLSSIYCNVPAYKTMKPRGMKSSKRDE